MPTRLILIFTVAAALIAGCGSSSEPTAATSPADVRALLEDAFAKSGNVKSATIDAKLGMTLPGQSTPVNATLSGPYETQGEGKLPKFQFDAQVEAQGVTISGGAAWLGDKGVITFKGQAYELSGEQARQLEEGYAKAAAEAKKQAPESKSENPFASLGIDPSKWLGNPRNAGEADVAGVSTIKVTGDVDLPILLDDIQRIGDKAGSLGLPDTAGSSAQLTPEMRKQALDTIKKASLEFYVGKDDHELRRITVAADLQEPTSKQTAKLTFDLTLSKLGDEQRFTAPTGAKPIEELTGELQGLLGGLAGGMAGTPDTDSGSGSSGSDSGSSDSGSSGSDDAPAITQDAIQKYAKCVEDAGSDAAKAQACADLLQG